MNRVINTVDLFCGAGGATTGLELALSRLGMTHRGIAINHWEVAVSTMRKNHPLIETKQMSIEEAVPADMVPSGEVDLLWASPSCTHHSRAKGGKPRSNQLRAQPELVLTWLDQLFVRRVIVENVPEFVEWGPLDRNGNPIKAKVGECFRAWVESLKARNYIVEWRIVNCADYGDATTRRRFFLKAVRRGCGKIMWPEATHAENPQPDLFGTKKPWRGIRECLDLNDTGKSIFNRKKPLAANTLRRIAAGLKKFCGLDFQMDMLGANGPDECRVRTTDKPMPTQHAGGNRVAVVRPFLVKLRNHGTAESVDEPITTITCSGSHHMICSPLILGRDACARCRPAYKPMPTLTTGGAMRVIMPFLITHQCNNAPRPIDKPVRTLTTVGKDYLCLPTFVVDNANGGVVMDGDKPLNTITTKDNHMSVYPVLQDGSLLDIRIRMLKPSELAAAHSFPADYVLTGNRGEQVKQIGNSVPVMTAAAMCQADLISTDRKNTRRTNADQGE